MSVGRPETPPDESLTEMTGPLEAGRTRRTIKKFGITNYLKESSNDGEGSVYEDSWLSYQQEEIVQLQSGRVVVAKSPHLPHRHQHRAAGQAVDDQLGEGGHLDCQLPQPEVLVGDEDKEDDEADDGDDEDDDATEEAGAGLAAVDAVAARLGFPRLQVTAVILELPEPSQLGELVLRPNVFPHDEQDGGADEAELDGAGEEEGAAALMQIMHYLQSKYPSFPRTEGEKLKNLFLWARTAERNVADINGVLIAHSDKVILSLSISGATKLARLHQPIKHVLILPSLPGKTKRHLQHIDQRRWWDLSLTSLYWYCWELISLFSRPEEPTELIK